MWDYFIPMGTFGKHFKCLLLMNYIWISVLKAYKKDF